MKLIVITDPEFIEGEAEACTALLEAGCWRLHIRKPHADDHAVASLIESIPERHYPAISLHDSYGLAVRYGIGGIHLNGRNTWQRTDGDGLIYSRSCHTLQELLDSRNSFGYMFLSPVFDSISKHGYLSAFPESDLLRAREAGTVDAKVIALGGVTPSGLPLLYRCGFGGAAVLGYIWEEFKKDRDVRALLSRFDELKRPDF